MLFISVSCLVEKVKTGLSTRDRCIQQLYAEDCGGLPGAGPSQQRSPGAERSPPPSPLFACSAKIPPSITFLIFWTRSLDFASGLLCSVTDLTSSTRLFISLTSLWFSCSNCTQNGKRLLSVASLNPKLKHGRAAVTQWWSVTCRWPHHLDLLGGELVLHSSAFLPRGARVVRDLWHTLLCREQNRLVRSFSFRAAQ